ncbi:MAG TPA: UDP-N-acetylmuramate:L-alanyl-gamma-D-glutamyl-meso-diaminopimelate ligase [Gammaproteobacteria bacterium]|jgi:UDP-N-acetylmuramate: L-alanyl-gamma-D-glutamyl-meso-diaminopimelate ligase|nr:UDP-N-acetylmuramate:L-alanyl-gamma-D-glutamyl-meso-diaminopimelate ligase [Gammaproteobacteria bacterium]
MRIHILGICGKFMSGIALLAKQCGHEVVGSDTNVYPPMSTQLEEQGIRLIEGYDPATIDKKVDCVIIGNVMRRGNPAVEWVLAEGIPYSSGPQWLAEHVLQGRWVLAVAGTHGKTTTTGLLTWLLTYAGLEPGFLIGGVPENFGVSAQLGKQPYFVIEADEYDSAFFDKRPKFIHYHPKTAILNNLEFDHADIFPDMAAIEKQFHYLVRTIPANGLIIHPAEDKHLKTVLDQGVWTPTATFGAKGAWQAVLKEADGSCFDVLHQGDVLGEVRWDLLGMHNVHNGLAALAAATHAGVPVAKAIEAFTTFKNVKRRLEIKAKVNDITVYDDFAHHPTAIATTLAGLRAKIGKAARMIAVLEFGSYTMRTGVHKDSLCAALCDADQVVCKNTEVDWGLEEALRACPQPAALYPHVDALVKALVPQLRAGDHVVVMSNGYFDGIHEKLLGLLSG